MKCRICKKPMSKVSLPEKPEFTYTSDGRLKNLTGEHVFCQVKKFMNTLTAKKGRRRAK